MRPWAMAARANPSRLIPPPSSTSSIAISLPTWRTVNRDLAGLGLARRSTRRARFDAVVERVAQQVLERSDELFQHRAVELGLTAADLEIRALVELLRRRAQDPVEPLGHAAERHRADREQLLLHVAREARLRDQRGIGVVQVLEQRLLHRRDVVDAFGQRARELLEARVTVEFERIEAFGRSRRPELIRDWICDSPWISISRTCERSRITLIP